MTELTPVIQKIKEQVSEEKWRERILCNQLELSPIHLCDVVEDFLATHYINLLKGLECMLNGGEPLYVNPNRLWYNAYFDEKIICDIEKPGTFDAFLAKLKETIDHILKVELFNSYRR